MAGTAERFLSPVGRYVQGDLFTPSDKDQQGAPRVIKTGPNAGQPALQWFIAVAFAKNDPAWPPYEAALRRIAAAAWPQFFPQGPMGPCQHPRFAYKIKDGDGVDQNGKPNRDKEGFAGHWIVSYATMFAPKVYPANQYLETDRILPDRKHLAKRGYYVRVSGTVEGNGNDQNPGIFVNMDMVEIAGAGPEIVGGPDAGATFGAVPIALPPGATAIPGGGAPYPPAVGAPPLPPGPVTAMHVMLPPAQGATYEAMLAAGWTDATLVQQGMMAAPAPVAPAPAPYTPPAPAPAPYTPPAPVAAAPAPYGGYAGITPPAAPVAPAPYVPPQRIMLPPSGGASYEQMIAAGWTDATLVQQGMMAP